MEGAALKHDVHPHPRGIDVGTGGFVPWSHVGRIGQTKVAGGVQALGVEVRNVAAYVGTLTPEQQRAALRTAKFGQKVGQPAPAADGDKSGDLDSIRKRDLAAALNWTAARSDGFHLTFPLLTLNKPADKLAEEVKAYAAIVGLPPSWGCGLSSSPSSSTRH